MRSHPLSSEAVPRRSVTPGSSSHGARKPGVCAPCPGAVMISIPQPCPVEVHQLNAGRYEVIPRKLRAFLQLTLRQCHRDVAHRAGALAARHTRPAPPPRPASRPITIATHKVKPSRPTEGV